MPIEIQEILQLVVDKGASDLHLKVGLAPMIRISGKLMPSEFDPVSKEDIQRMVFSMLTGDQRKPYFGPTLLPGRGCLVRGCCRPLSPPRPA